MKTKQKIKEAFWELYTQKGLESISVSGIAKKAGIHRATFYEYYKDKFAILEEIEQSLFQELSDLPMPNVDGTLQEVFDGLYQYTIRNRCYLEELLGRHRDANLENRFLRLWTEKQDQAVRHLYGEIDTGQMDRIRVLAGSLFHGFIVSVLTTDMEKEQIFALLCDLLVNGFLPVLERQTGLSMKPEMRKKIEELRIQLSTSQSGS